MFSRYLAKGVRVENSADQPGFEEAVKKKKREIRDQNQGIINRLTRETCP
jgi:hypothetical protein